MANIGPPLILAIDATGTSEARPLVFSFAKDPLILGGDSLANVIPAITQAAPSGGQPPLTFGSPALDSGTSTWTIEVSVVLGSPNQKYQTACRAQTAAGYYIEAFVDVILEGIGNSPAASPVPGPAPGTYGDSLHIPVVTIDAFGRVTVISSVSVSGVSGTFGG